MRAVLFDLDHTMFTAEGTLRDGAKELLDILRRLGIRIGGLSNGDHRVLVRLDEAGIIRYFDRVLCADQTLEPKAVAGVHHLLSLLQVQTHETTLVSRAHADILLAKDAGIAKTIGISHGLDAAPLSDAGADHIVAAVPDVLDVLE
jgi:phosphoglycolate phosphatase-like HAD superfamily hydrolase